uniref:DNA-directed RNA polymerase III subunit RPC3 n=1 Tax=Alona affinis TaxID=381656 RepID=A0A9N6WRY0_9CRUS|nr:EOG090X04YD [Alona affinis]
MAALTPSSEVCSELLKLYFGQVIAQTRKALATLIQYNFVKFEMSERSNNIAEYSAIAHHIYSLVRYPKYLYLMKVKYGDQAEILLEVLLNQGQDNASHVIFQAANRLREAESGESLDPAPLYEMFTNLAANQFIIRCTDVTETSSSTHRIPKLAQVEEKDEFSVPQLNIGPLAQKLKDKATELGSYSDSNIIWRVNFDRFEIEMRNVLLVNAAARRVDAVAGELFHLMLEMWNECSRFGAPVTNSIDLNQIRDKIRKKTDAAAALREHLDNYLRVLEEDESGLLTKSGDAGGGQYVLNYRLVFEKMACATLDSIVLQKFGPKALRLFKVTREEKHIEHDHMHSLSTILPKEVKMLSYQLLEHNFLQMQELKKGTSTSAPIKSFILFHVDVMQVVRMVLRFSYQGLFNLLVRKDHIAVENKRLFEKHERMESLLATLQGAPEEEIAFVEDSATPAEKFLIAKVQAFSDLLTIGSVQVDETILILEAYIQYVDAK